MLVAFILGLVEGLTEFLPVSSTGHLILAAHWLGYLGEKASTFEIFIQMGAISAVIVVYPSRFRSFLDFKKTEGFSGSRGILLLILSTLPALILGFLLHSWIKHHLFTPPNVAIGFIAGAFWILIAEKFYKNPQTLSLDEISPLRAFKIGCFQCLAMWPGFSRSGATILGGMALGLDRRTAAEFSFFAAVPVLSAAAVLDLIKSLDALSISDVPFFAVGFVVSFLTALAVIKLFVGFVSRHSLSIFAWYRFAVGIAILFILK